MNEVFAENLIPNGAVEASIDGWEAITGDLSHATFTSGNGAIKLAATEDDQDIGFKSTETIALIKSHKYYMSFRVAQYGDATKVVRVYWPEDDNIPVSSAVTPKTGTWYRATGILDVSRSTSGMYSVRFEIPGVASTQYAYFDEILLVDLTAAFGAGNEPDVTWCNQNLAYFDGRKSLGLWQTLAIVLEATVVPTEVVTGTTATITAKVRIDKKLYNTESWYTGEVYAGEA